MKKLFEYLLLISIMGTFTNNAFAAQNWAKSYRMDGYQNASTYTVV
jgi:hypothetical protein